MMRQISLLTACLMAGFSVSHADVLVNTRKQGAEFLSLDTTLQYDLDEHFQVYSGSGPVATFTLYMPFQNGFMDLFVETTYDDEGGLIPSYTGDQLEIMTYKLLGEGTYDHLYSASADTFEWRQVSVQYQLLADIAPLTVSNFVQYIGAGAYENVIVHRSEISVLQAGALKLYQDDPETEEDDAFVLQYIDRESPVVFEGTLANTIGTLAMARTQNPDSASSEFFINLEDNTANFGTAYTVFGELQDADNALPLLQEMGDVQTYNLTSIYRSAPVSTIPLYAPFWEDQESYARFQSITVPEGSSAGVSYTWEWADSDGEPDTVSDEEAANQAVFDIAINGSDISISRHDSGVANLTITGTGGGDSASFTMLLIGYNADALAVFSTSDILQGGILDSSWYGQMNAESYPDILHSNHQRQYAAQYYNATALQNEYYFYDYGLESWLYTTTTRYPLFYAFNLGDGEWIEYQLDTGDADTPRWFYNFNTPGWFSNLGAPMPTE